MNANEPILSGWTTDPDLLAAIDGWVPRNGLRPELTLEPRPDGLRVKLTYLGVETGVLFARGAGHSTAAVRATLDRVFEVLSWRVISRPA